MQDKIKQQEERAMNGSSPRPLTREEKRRVDRVTELAMERFNKFAESFSNWLYDTDGLTDEMVKQRVDELNAKWKVYCKEMRLTQESIGAIKEYCEKLYALYKEELTGGEKAD
jgi:uncharacterized HAD superfamily protein